MKPWMCARSTRGSGSPIRLLRPLAFLLLALTGRAAEPAAFQPPALPRTTYNFRNSDSAAGECCA
jgi:hypothetical protein